MTQAKTFLAPLGSGIGDVVIAMPIFESLCAQNSGPVWLVARGPRQMGFDERIPNLAGTVREVDLQSVIGAGDRYINLRDHPIQRQYDWYGEQFARDYPGFGVNEIMTEVCRSHEISADFNSLPRFISGKVDRLRNTVVVVPGTTSNFKSWPPARWLELTEKLKADGDELVVLGEPDRSSVVADLIAAGLHRIETPTIGDAIDVISSARAVIAVDTGLMHIAVQQGIPTVSIFNNVHTYYRPASHCSPVFGPVCAPECWTPCGETPSFPVAYDQWIWWDGKFDSCKAEAPCMSTIPATVVYEAYMSLALRGSFA